MNIPQKGRIFINYRRADSAGYAGRIYDRLSAHFGTDAVFMDVDMIEAGLDFVTVLQDAAQSCDVLVALIGRQWLNITDETGKRRLNNPEDFVRVEIATALNRNIRVIPVLLDGTAMPLATELPNNLMPLARRNALQVNHHSFNMDVQRLISQLESALRAAEKVRQEGVVRTLSHKSVETILSAALYSKSVEQAEKYTPSGFPLYTFAGIEFVKVLAGTFVMGSNDKDVNADKDEKPQHVVDIPYDYYISRCPVTNQQYADFTIAANATHPVVKWEKKRNHPVVNVSWDDAMMYCSWLERLIESELPNGLIFRLPTEAEWEKAARGKKGTIYPWGDIFDKSLCNTNESEIGSTTPVGMYSPQSDSRFGCADMSGNVWEWTYSLCKPYPYQVDDSREDAVANGDRVIRGGSFRRLANHARCASRGIARKDNPDIGGFRVVASKLLP